MIIVVHAHQLISELLLVFSREKSPSVLGNYTFNSSEYNGKLEGEGGRRALHYLLFVQFQAKAKFYFCDEQPKVKSSSNIGFCLSKKKIPSHTDTLV